MKIAFLGPAYPFRGGISQFLHNMADNLISENEVEVFTFKSQYPKLIFPGKGQLDITKNKSFKYSIHRVLTPYRPLTWMKTAQKIIDSKPDFLIIKFWIPFFSISYLYIMKYLKMNSDIKLCLLCHNMDFHEKWFLLSKFTGLLLEYTDKLIVLSDIVARSAVRYKAYNPNKLIKLFHPLYEVSEVKTDKQILCKQLDIKPLKTIMFFGYIKLYKGLDVFLKAIPLVHQDYRDVQFLVAGEIYRNDKIYKEIIRKYPDEINFVLHDKFIPNTDIDKYFSIADVIVVPYRSATQSGIVQLAYSYKKPVIVSNVEGLKDMVIDNQTGLVFEQNNHNLLAEKILEFLKSTNNFAKYIEEYNDKYSWKNFTDKLLQALKA